MSGCRLAVVVPDLSVGGLQNMAVGLATALDPSEFTPAFYTFDAGGPLEERLAALDIAHVHLPRGEGVKPGHARLMASRFRADGIQLVHCHNVTALFHGARAARLAGRLPVLFTEHDREMPAPWRHRVLHRWLARHVDRTVAVSASLADDLVRYEGFPRERTGCLVNGIEDPARRFPGDRAAARRELGWGAERVILAVGNLTEVKNHAGLLDAFERLAADRGNPVRLLVAGAGPLEQSLRARARDLPPGSCELLGTRHDVPRLLAAADVFVLPSHREGLPLSLVEAHAMGRPSVAFDVGGNGEVIVDGETGRLVAYPDTGALAAALAEVLDDNALANRWGAAGRRRFLELFTHDRMVEAYVRLFDELLAVRAA